MVEVRVQSDGRIQLPPAVRDRFGIRPGTLLVLDDDNDEDSIRLRVVPEEAQLVQEGGVWVIRSRSRIPEDREVDWVQQVREERIASILVDRIQEP